MSDSERDPLEQFFRRKASEYEIPFREEDWLKLEQMLELRKMQRLYRLRLRRLGMAALLLIGVMGYFIYDNSNRIHRIDQFVQTLGSERFAEQDRAGSEAPQPESQSSTVLPDQKPAEGPVAVHDDSGSDSSAILSDAAIGSDFRSGSDRVDVSGSGTPSISASPFASDPKKGPPLKNTTESEFPAGGASLPLYHLTDQSSPAIRPIGLSGGPVSTRAVYPVGTIRAEMPGRDGIRSELLPPESEEAAASELPVRNTGAEQPRITAGVILSPDLSTAGALKEFDSPGYRLGLVVEYRLARNLSISSGLIHSGVRYATRSADRGFGRYSGVTPPDETFAECLILDIPLALKYNFVNFSGSRFFLSTGLSSYIMLDERYRFHYGNNNELYSPGAGNGRNQSPDRMETWSGKTGAGHWLGIASLSAGFEWDIHSDWSLQVEPYLRIPLRDVGWGQVRLYSIGTFLSLRYRIAS